MLAGSRCRGLPLCRVALCALSLLGSRAALAQQGGAATPIQAPVAVKTVTVGATPLDRFLAGLQTWQAGFSQTLTDSRGRRLEAVRGRLQVARPGRFRWEVQALGTTGADGVPTQVMVADGRNVWFYDRELEQVTVKPAASALTATPAMLLAGGAEVRSEFAVEPARPVNATSQFTPANERLEWVRVKPRRLDAEFREARLGFVGLSLRRMEIEDRLGQTAKLEFSDSLRNGALSADAFRFVPPDGVDVIGKPAS